MVSKDYFRATLAHEYLREESEEMEYLRSAGKRAFLKSIEADTTQLISASARGDRKQVQMLLGMGAERLSELHIHTFLFSSLCSRVSNLIFTCMFKLHRKKILIGRSYIPDHLEIGPSQLL